MATKKKTTTKATTARKAGSKAKPKATPKPKAPKDNLVVFAFRLSEAERNAIHKTAGPRNATRLVRQVAVAFARRDEAAFRAAVKEAGK